MALPKQVQAQADALAEFEKQVAAGNTPADDPKPTEDPPADPAPEPTPQPQEPAPAEPPKPAEDADKWKQRYLSLQGQFNSQVPALQDQVRQLTETVTQLTAKLEQQTTKPVEPQEPSELVTNKDVEAFGEDLVDLARRIAKEEFGKRESKYIKQIEALEGQLAAAKGDVDNVAQNQAQTAMDRFFEGLTKAIPTWQEVQATEECQTWLTTRVPGTRATWDQALKQAAADRDVAAVVEVFDVFFEKHPNLNPKAKQQKADSAKQELSRQVAPGKSTATAQPQGKRTYSQQDYWNESQRQLTAMKQGRMEEAQRIEAELDAALREGRVSA